MLDINSLAEGTLEWGDHLLKDGIWGHAAFYELCTESVYWNQASITTLSKIYAASGTEALLYLLQKEAFQLSLWQKEWQTTTPPLKDFINAVISWKRFSNPAGKSISIAHFWRSYCAMLSGLKTAPSFQFTKDGELIPYMDVFEEKDLQQAICFDDDWREQNYLLETSTDWILFNWVTGA